MATRGVGPAAVFKLFEPMRLDRLVTLSFARSLRNLMDGSGVINRRKSVLPVLMYHSISKRDESHLKDYFKVCTPPERFREQMEILQAAGYLGVDLETGLARLEEGNGGCDRLVGITFDDGFLDFFTAALPVLQAKGFRATMYLPTGFIGNVRREFLEIPCMTWDEVRAARKTGMQFGSHTVHHPKLHGLPWSRIDQELTESKRQLESELGESVSAFAYPYAYPGVDRGFCHRFGERLRAAGYRSCVTTTIGRVRSRDEFLELKRLPANAADDGPLLLAKLNGDYDWLGLVQKAAKRFKRGNRTRNERKVPG